jgi:cytochrome c oxidase subunit IV
MFDVRPVWAPGFSASKAAPLAIERENLVSEHHIVSPKVYFTIFAVLMICTFLTVAAAKVDLNQYFSGLNIIVALTIATLKASLVVLFFMHGKYSPKRTQLVIICSVFWLAVMLFMTMSDYISRPWS